MTGIFMGAFASGSLTSNSILVYGSINAEPFTIDTQVINNTSANINSVMFNMLNTDVDDGDYIVIGPEGPTSITPPSGGTAVYTGSEANFGFNTTGFNPGENLVFRWDPDSSLNPNYGGTELDFIGGIVTATTTSGNYSGVFVQIGSTNHVQAVLTPVP